MRVLLTLVVAACVGGAGHAGEPKKDAGPIELKIVAKKDSYKWDGGGMTPMKFKKHLEELAEKMKKDGFGVKPPPAPTVDLVLQVVNTGKEEVTVFVGGDPNVYKFELKGPGTFA